MRGLRMPTNFTPCESQMVLSLPVGPSGKLPATFEKRWEDNPCYPYYHLKDDKKTPYTEGIFVGYRGYDEKQVKPQFCFGHGLSYTQFKYGKVDVTPKMMPPGGKVVVTVEVRNTGKVAGDEVVQLYAHPKKSSVKQPPKRLCGFERVSLQPGEQKKVSMILAGDQLGYYDVKTHEFAFEPAEWQLLVGSSSRDIRGKGRVKLGVPGM